MDTQNDEEKDRATSPSSSSTITATTVAGTATAAVALAAAADESESDQVDTDKSTNERVLTEQAEGQEETSELERPLEIRDIGEPAQLRPLESQMLMLEGTHTTATDTESCVCFKSKLRHVETNKRHHQVVEECPAAAPSTSKVVEHVREYVKQIETLLELDGSMAAQVVDVPRATLRIDCLECGCKAKAEDESTETKLAVALVQRDSPEPAKKEEKEQENQEIAERFKQIMEMFDSFTKNLESLEVPTAKGKNKEKELARKVLEDMKHDNEREFDVDRALSVIPGSAVRIETAKPETTDKEGAAACTDVVLTMLPPLQHDIATTCSGLHLPQSASTDVSTIACQTSTSIEFMSMLPPTSSSSFSTSSPSEMQNEGLDLCSPTVFSSNMGVNQPSPKAVSIEVSRMEMVKPAPSLLQAAEPPAVTTPPTATVTVPAGPMERTFHTIHIEALSSPSSSALHRPPLRVRMWNVITDFCAAVCLCLQVNKDCIFCLGFFIAFVVSASFLTAFFYRTLSMSPQLFPLPPGQTNAVRVQHKDTFM